MDYSILRLKLISGVQWNALGQVLNQIILVIGSIILSRLLNPDVFGLFTILVVFGNSLNLLVGFGFNHAIIQNRDLTSNDLTSFFWINILLGTLIASLFFLATPLIAKFYNEPTIIPVARVFSLAFIITAGVTVPAAQLARTLSFKTLTIINFVSLLASYSGGIIMAVAGFGVWSLLFQYIFFQFINLILSLYYSDWNPTFFVDSDSVRKVQKFIRSLLPSQLVDYYATNSDLILIGKFFGSNDLGLYGRAQAIIMLPVTNISILLAKSFFSAFTHLQDQAEELRRNYLNSVKLVALLTLPVLIPIAIVSDDFVSIIFGDAWMKMAPFISLLCLAGIFGSFNGMSDALITSQGQTALLLRIVISEKVIFLFLIIGGAFYGLIGVAIGKVISQLFSLFFRTYMQRDILRLSISGWLLSFTKIIVSIVIMVLSGIILKNYLLSSDIFVRFALMVMILNLVFFGTLWVQKEPIIFSVFQIAKEKLQKEFK